MQQQIRELARLLFHPNTNKHFPVEAHLPFLSLQYMPKNCVYLYPDTTKTKSASKCGKSCTQNKYLEEIRLIYKR